MNNTEYIAFVVGASMRRHAYPLFIKLMANSEPLRKPVAPDLFRWRHLPPHARLTFSTVSFSSEDRFSVFAKCGDALAVIVALQALNLREYFVVEFRFHVPLERLAYSVLGV